jgi:AcrR family transcriptional regulator
MARQVNSDATVTRKRLIGAAAGLFAERGMKGTSVRDIAREAGVNAAMVSHYFGGKEGLYQASVDAMYAELAEGREGFMESLRGGELPIHLVENTVREACRFACRQRGAVRLVLRHVLDRGELDPERRAHVLLPFLDEVSGWLAAASNRSPVSLRMSLQSLVFLIVRYAVMNDEELAMVTGAGTQARAEVENHLIEVGIAALGLQTKE